MNQKSLIAILGVVVVILIGTTVYFATIKNVSQPVAPAPKNDLTAIPASWKTYSNKTIGIEFRYPSSWPTLSLDNGGDILKDGKIYNSFVLDLVDLSSLQHTLLGYDNMSIDKQYEEIQCQTNAPYLIECVDRISSNGVKYVWAIEETIVGPSYAALVATGKYILVFSFQEKDNYDKRADEYQKLLSTLKIPE